MIPTDYPIINKTEHIKRSSSSQLTPLNKFIPLMSDSCNQERDSSKLQGLTSKVLLKPITTQNKEQERFEAISGVAKHIATVQNAQNLFKPRPHRLEPLHEAFTKQASPPSAPTIEPILRFSPTEEVKSVKSQKDLDKDLINCIVQGDLEAFKRLSESVDINRPLEQEGEESFSPLIWAITKKQLPIIRYLIEERNATIDTLEGIKSGKVPVIVKALIASSPKIAKYLISKGAFLDEPFCYGDRKGPPLTYFAYKGALNQIQFLVESLGANVNVKDSNGNSALYYTLKRLSFEQDKENSKRLQEIAMILVDYDADIEETDAFGKTLLMRLAEKKYLRGVKMLAVDFIADTQAKNQLGLDALSIVLNSLNKSKLRESEIRHVEGLFDFLTQTSTQEQLKIKLADQIRSMNERACSLILEKYKIDIDEAINTDEDTFLLSLTKEGMLEHINMLLRLGANPQKKNLLGISACSYASERLKEFDPCSKVNWRPIYQALNQDKAGDNET